ncbi:MAG TPA: RIP metalloprotease RseP [Candidatus Cloacimonadota bacterium]|mgnify:FL=1|nr:RIP metalloprotease RseP [Candidatus Cloacimonadota bacterium]
MLNLLAMLIALGVMITIHELGHFLAARAFGVGILKFSIGFGKPIAEFERAGTKYRIAWIPLGGYVKMEGENPDEVEAEAGSGHALTPAFRERSFQYKAWWKKAIIAVSGPFANLILGILLFIVSLSFPQTMEDINPVIKSAEGKWSEVFSPGDSLVALNGEPVIGFNHFLSGLYQHKHSTVLVNRGEEHLLLKVSAAERDSLVKSLKPVVGTRIGEVFSGMPAWRAGLKAGDRILQVDSVAVDDWYAMRELIMNAPEGKVELIVARDDQILQRSISLESNVAMGDTKMIGVSHELPVAHTIRYSLPQALKYGSLSAVNFIGLNYSGLFKLIKKPEQLKSNLGGPVMLASMSQEIGKRGIGSLILFFGSISLILMIMNLLPIPVLDGGHIMFCIIEGIIGRPVPLKIQAIAQRIGLLILVTLMVFAFYSDISKLFLRFMHSR